MIAEIAALYGDWPVPDAVARQIAAMARAIVAPYAPLPSQAAQPRAAE